MLSYGRLQNSNLYFLASYLTHQQLGILFRYVSLSAVNAGCSLSHLHALRTYFPLSCPIVFLAVTKRVHNKALNDVIENEKTEDANSPSLVNFLCLSRILSIFWCWTTNWLYFRTFFWFHSEIHWFHSETRCFTKCLIDFRLSFCSCFTKLLLPIEKKAIYVLIAKKVKQRQKCEEKFMRSNDKVTISHAFLSVFLHSQRLSKISLHSRVGFHCFLLYRHTTVNPRNPSFRSPASTQQPSGPPPSVLFHHHLLCSI